MNQNDSALFFDRGIWYFEYLFISSPQASSMGKRSLRRLIRGRAGRAWSQTTGGRKKALTIDSDFTHLLTHLLTHSLTSPVNQTPTRFLFTKPSPLHMVGGVWPIIPKKEVRHTPSLPLPSLFTLALQALFAYTSGRKKRGSGRRSGEGLRYPSAPY